VVANFSQDLPGYGMVTASAQVQPPDVTETFADFDAIAADLAAHEVSADEFARAVKPRLEAAQRNQSSNGFWLTFLAGSQDDPRRLAFAATQADQLKTLTPADVRAAAQKWLVKDKSWRVMVIPQAP
jgi:zinc protease